MHRSHITDYMKNILFIRFMIGVVLLGNYTDPLFGSSYFAKFFSQFTRISMKFVFLLFIYKMILKFGYVYLLGVYKEVLGRIRRIRVNN